MKRPAGVTILALLAIVSGSVELLWALVSTWQLAAPRPGAAVIREPVSIVLLPGIARSLLGLAYVGIGLGLLR
jgi:hypothetical protein